MSRLEDVGGLIAAAVGVLLAVAVGVLIFTGGLHHRSVCADFDSGAYYTTDWEFSVFSWFAGVVQSVDEQTGAVCQNETYTQYLVGQVPLVGDYFEQSIGGPDDSTYYDNN